VTLPVEPTALSLRERIMQHFKTRFESVQAGNIVRLEDGGTASIQTTWNTVTRKPLTKEQLRFGAALALFDSTEAKTPETLTNRVTLTVIIEFFDQIKAGEEPSTLLNQMLLDVQHIMNIDRTCGGLCLDIREAANELSVDGPGENLLGGMARFEVIYRHRAASPRIPR
jgi:hypothetical protein